MNKFLSEGPRQCDRLPDTVGLGAKINQPPLELREKRERERQKGKRIKQYKEGRMKEREEEKDRKREREA